jgi:hypothetical protein
MTVPAAGMSLPGIVASGREAEVRAPRLGSSWPSHLTV